MKRLFFILLLFTFQLNAQTIRIAISDFENLSGNAKYDGLGKALSSMLISDIELNVSKKKLQLVERSQLNKILKEQSIQSGKAFDKNTTVKLGKLLGINFVLIGDIFVLNDELVINARLTSVENGEIKFSNKQTGKLSQWLAVKTKIAKELSDNLKLPFVEPSIIDKEMSPGILASFSNAVAEFDKGNFEKAIVISETIKSINPDFNYVDDL
jgi:TolB-like protein